MSNLIQNYNKIKWIWFYFIFFISIFFSFHARFMSRPSIAQSWANLMIPNHFSSLSLCSSYCERISTEFSFLHQFSTKLFSRCPTITEIHPFPSFYQLSFCMLGIMHNPSLSQSCDNLFIIGHFSLPSFYSSYSCERISMKFSFHTNLVSKSFFHGILSSRTSFHSQILNIYFLSLRQLIN